MGFLILNNFPNIGGYTVQFAFRRPDSYLHLATVCESVVVLIEWQEYLPHSIIPSIHWMAGSVPVIELTKKVELMSSRCPFPVNPPISILVKMDSIALMNPGKFQKA